MLEKQKEWCQNKVEKGKKWVKKNKDALILGAGCATTTAVLLGIEKLLENKQAGIAFGHIENADGSWSDDFRVETYGVNRFGKVNRGNGVQFPQEDAEWIANAAKQIVEDIKEHNKS